MKQYDFVMIGSGIAGLTFGLKAAKHGSVAVSRKESRGLHFTLDYPELAEERFKRDTLVSRT